MPDEPTLNSIGIRTIPKWYRDVNAPKNGWVGRPAPSDQLWRGKPARPAQPPQPLKPFPTAQSKPFTYPVQPVMTARPSPNGPFIGVASPSYQPLAPPGPKVFGRASQTPEQRHAPSFFPNAPVQAISAPPSLHNTHQPMQSFAVPNLLPFTSPQIANRNSNFSNFSTAVHPNYRPLTPSSNPTPAAPTSVAPSLPKSTSPPYEEPQTPLPVHRRLFVPAGEPAFVTNPVPANEGKGKAKEVKRMTRAVKRVPNENESSDFLLDFE